MRLVAVAPNPSIDRLYEVDRLERDAINRPRVETRVAGGKGLNVARAAVALGAEVSALALLAGHAGRWVAEALAGEGIAGRYAWTDGETRSCVAVHDATDDTLTELNEAGPPVSAAGWAGFVETLRAELVSGGAGLISISGSLPPGAPPDGLAQLASVGRRADVRVALDAGGPVLGPALQTGPWLVKLNAAEAGVTLGLPAAGDDARAVEAARGIAARSGGAVIVTRGLAGAVAVGPDGAAFRVAPPPVRGSYPVGGGDAFLAGVAVATLRGRSFDDALRLGAAAAIANALVRGAGRFDPSEAERLAAVIRVTPIAG